ncbi:PH domain-containing protein [Streptomyces sp. NPDC059385]
MDTSGIRIRGPLRTRFVAWEQVRGFTEEHWGGTAPQRLMPRTAAYAHLADGRRIRLAVCTSRNTTLTSKSSPSTTSSAPGSRRPARMASGPHDSGAFVAGSAGVR